MSRESVPIDPKLIIHYGSINGAACGAQSGSLTLSTSLKWVNCPKCIELQRSGRK
jgi:hypothetical protein